MKIKYFLPLILIFTFYLIPYNALALEPIMPILVPGASIYTYNYSNDSWNVKDHCDNCTSLNVYQSGINLVRFYYPLQSYSSGISYTNKVTFNLLTTDGATSIPLSKCQTFINANGTAWIGSQSYPVTYDINSPLLFSTINYSNTINNTYNLSNAELLTECQFSSALSLSRINITSYSVTSNGSTGGGNTGGGSSGVDMTETNKKLDEVNDNLKNVEKEQKETNKKLDDINNSLTDDDTSEAEENATGFFDNFKQDNHGLGSVVTAPLGFIQALTTAKCEPLSFQLPIVHDEINLPCMRPIYDKYFGSFFRLYQVITTGLICYNVCLNLYKKVRDMQNPNNDKIEVLNL